MAKITIEYDLFDEESSEHELRQMIADRIADEIRRDAIIGSTGYYTEHINKVSVQIRNDIAKRVLNLISDSIIEKIESQLEHKLNTDFNKLIEDKVCERVNKRIQDDVLQNIKTTITKEVKNVFRSIQ